MPPAKVYVNLKEACENGHPITAKVKADTVAGGRRSSWAIEADAENIGTQASLGLVGGAQVAEEDARDGDSRVFKNKVKLPQQGGNKYRIKVAKIHKALLKKNNEASVVSAQDTAGATVAAEKKIELEAHRKVYVGINCMPSVRPLIAGMMEKVQELFAGTFIDIVGPAEADIKVLPQQTLINADHTTDLAEQAERAPTDHREKLWTRITIIDRVLSVDQKVGAESIGFTVDQLDDRLLYEGGEFYVARKLPVAAPGGIQKLAEVRGIVTYQGIGFKLPGKSVPVTPDDYTVELQPLAEKARDEKFKVNFTSERARAAVAAHKECTVKYRFKLRTGGKEFFVYSYVDRIGGKCEVTLEVPVKEAAGVREGGAPWFSELAIVSVWTKNVADDANLGITVADDGLSYRVLIKNAEVKQMLKAALVDEPGQWGTLDVNIWERTGTELSGRSTNCNVCIAAGGLLNAYKKAGDPAKAEAKTKEALARVVAHELFHALGGPVKTMDGVVHPNWYGESEGGGATLPSGHCSYGAVRKTDQELLDGAEQTSAEDRKKGMKPKDDRTLNLGIWHKRFREPDAAGKWKAAVWVPRDPDAAIPSCIMFHTVHPWFYDRARFCADCIKQARLYDLAPTPHGTGRVAREWKDIK